MREHDPAGGPSGVRARYAPFYCEENLLWLCLSLGEGARAVLVTNAARRVEMRQQKTGEPTSGALDWDYHAFGLSQRDGWLAWDLDSWLPWPVAAADYLRLSFVAESEEPPLFRVIAADQYASEFRSDRSHMLRPDGTWIATPPPWPAQDQAGGVRLHELLDPDSRCLGEVLSLDDMLARY